LRLDLLPPNTQPQLRELFRRYVDARLSVYQKLPDVVAARQELANCASLQGEIWKAAVAASATVDSPSTPALVLPAINNMIDITTTRTVAAQTHPPTVVFVMLLILVMASSFLAGYAMAAAGRYRDWPHMLCFAIVMTATIFVILDYEFPRLGMIRLDNFDYVLVDLRSSMK